MIDQGVLTVVHIRSEFTKFSIPIREALLCHLQVCFLDFVTPPESLIVINCNDRSIIVHDRLDIFVLCILFQVTELELSEEGLRCTTCQSAF